MSKNTLLSELINYVSYDGTGKVTVTTGLVVNNVSNGRIDVLPDYAQNYFVSYAPGAASQSKLVLISAGVSFRPGWGADIYMDLDASGNLGVGGAANSSYKLNVTGTGRFTGALTGTSATFSGLITASDNIRVYGAAQFYFNSVFRGQIVAYNAYGGGSDYSPFLTSETSLAFGVNGNATKALMIASDGKVGIGTTSPSAKLNVSGDIHIGDYGTAALRLLDFRTSNSIFSIQTDGTSGSLGTNIIYSWANGGQGPLKFSNASGEVMRLAGNGNVGIGVTDPQGQLHINQEMVFSEVGYNTVRLHKIQHQHSDGSSVNNNLRFLVSDGSGTTAERMRITGAGNLLVGTTAATAKITIGDGAKASNSTPFAIQTSDANQMMLVVSRNINLYYNIESIEQGVSYRSIYFNLGGGGVYAGTQRLDNNSDLRVKHNIQPVDNALNTVMSLSGKKFNMRDESNVLRYGFIAQEVQPVLNDFVTTSTRSYKDGDTLIENILTLESSGTAWAALLVEAIKEQQIQIEELKQLLNN